MSATGNRPRGSLVAKTALLAAIVLACAVAVETSVHLLDLVPVGMERFQYDAHVGWTIDPELDSRHEVSPDGFRIDPARPPEPGRRTVVVLGDSFAEGFAYPYAVTFAGLIESWLQRAGAGDEWQVVNLGVSGWGSTQELIAYQRWGARYRPEVVVWQAFPFNDMCNNTVELARTCSLQDQLRPYHLDRGGTLRIGWEHPWRHRLRDSLAFRLVEAQLVWGNGGLIGPDPTDEPGFSKARAEYFDENSRRVGLATKSVLYSLATERDQTPLITAAWERTSRIVAPAVRALADQGVIVIPVVIPLANTYDPYWLRYNSKLAGIQLDPSHATQRWESVVADPRAQVVSLRSEIDADPDMEWRDFFFPRGMDWDQHLNRYGHFRVARAIAARMLASGVLSRDPSPPDTIAGPVDFISDKPAPYALVQFSEAKTEGARRWLHGFGPESTVVFRSETAAARTLHLKVVSLYSNRTVTVLLNGTPVATIDATTATATTRAITLPLARGRNAVHFRYADWSEGQPRDTIRFVELRLE